MLDTLKTLALVAVIAAATTVLLPAKADAQHYYGYGYYGHGYYGHGYYGHGYYGHGYYGHGYYGHGYYGHGYYGHGYYGHGYYGHGFGYGGYGPYGYGGYGPYGYGANRNSNQGAVRIEVDPKESRDEVEVYVDEAHAGVVDDFDGVFQRLYLPAGKHEIEIRLDGYHTIRMAIFVSPGSTYHVRGRMESVVAD